MLWSELLSSSLIFQSVILHSTLLDASVKSMLLLPFLFSKVVLVLGSFIICICLLIMYSSSCFPLLLVVVSCQDVDLALLSIVIITPTLFPCCSIVSTLFRSCSIGFCLSQYMLTNIITVSPLVMSRVMVSSSESCDIILSMYAIMYECMFVCICVCIMYFVIMH